MKRYENWESLLRLKLVFSQMKIRFGQKSSHSVACWLLLMKTVNRLGNPSTYSFFVAQLIFHIRSNPLLISLSSPSLSRICWQSLPHIVPPSYWPPSYPPAYVSVNIYAASIFWVRFTYISYTPFRIIPGQISAIFSAFSCV